MADETREAQMGRLEPEMKQRLLDGDEAAFSQLVERFERPVIRFISRMVGDRVVAEDLFQETFVRIIRALPRYEPRGAFSTWVFAIARNLCLDHLKYKRRHPAMSLDNAATENKGKVIFFRDLLESSVGEPHQKSEANEAVERVRQALQKLPEEKRETLILRVFHDLPYAEIAEITDVPVGTAKYRVHDAIRVLGDIYRGMSRGGDDQEEATHGM